MENGRNVIYAIFLSVWMCDSAAYIFGKKFEKKGPRLELVDKPDVKKAGGVFYTPQHVVDHIVSNTFRKLFYRKKYSEISKMRILDPACGSGSFLIGAFGKLMNYHLEYLILKQKK